MEESWREALNGGVSLCEQSEDGIVALEKPCGVLSHPNAELQSSKSSILTCKYSLKFEKYLLEPTNSAVHLLNRLDAPVSGLILVALNEKIAEAARVAFENRSVEKKYLALLKGYLLSESGCWKSSMAKVGGKNCVRAAKCGSVLALTKYRLIKELPWKNFTLSLVELQPITGRTHQLRLHCSQNHVPIIGDKTYGNFNFNRQFYKLTGENRLFLHSNEVCLRYELDGLSKIFRAKSKYHFADYCPSPLAK
ncbi:MAG: RNA pseudouridine synthase [Puniceicoccales bacterium]|jgi:23S rRNA-/tRNA-specific pseudouridylate synthase|nr:RNA pseudouridine synthase [Puniceicoccales bacterium]